MLLYLRLLLAAFAAVFSVPVWAQKVKPHPGRYFVSPQGNDTWSGLRPNPNAAKTDGPFATLARARDALRPLPYEKAVYVRGGTYYLREPVTLTPADSGARFLAYPGEKPVLSGGRPITGWRKNENNVYTAFVPEIKNGTWSFRQLRVGGERQTCARFPNLNPDDPHRDGWSFVAYSGPQPRASAPAYKNRFEFRPGDLKPYPLSPEPEIHIFPAEGWVNAILGVKRIDMDQHVVHIEENRSASQDLRVGNRFFVSNVREELDAPGEWFLDKAKGTVHYLPQRTDFERRGVVASVLDHVFDLQGDPASDRWVERVVIQGFEITDTTYGREIDVYTPMDAAVRLSGARLCVVENNRFVNIGGYAVRLDRRSSHNEIVGNEVAYAGQGGVVLTGSRATQPQHNRIAGNWIHHGGQVYKHVAGVYGVSASHTRVAHNRIEHMPRYGISFKSFGPDDYGHHNAIEYNDVLWTNEETNDTGAIETLGRDRQDTSNVIQYNRILDVVGLQSTPDGKIVSPHFTWGIYLDDYSSGTLVKGNLVARHDLGGGCVHGGRNNVFDNNIFIEGASHQMRYQVRDDFCANNRFVRNIVYYTAPYAELFKHTGRWRKDVLAESDYNLFWHKNGAAFFTQHSQELQRPLTPLGTLSEWQKAGFDKNSTIADPLFVDPAGDDYRLEPGSPALKLGFTPLPLDKIGLQGYDRAWKRTFAKD